MTELANRISRWLRRHPFLRDQRGASAVEFAIVAGPFFFLIMWLLQLGVYAMTQVALDNGLIAEAETVREDLVVGTLPSASTIKSGVVAAAAPWFQITRPWRSRCARFPI